MTYGLENITLLYMLIHLKSYFYLIKIQQASDFSIIKKARKITNMENHKIKNAQKIATHTSIISKNRIAQAKEILLSLK